jgi:uncharacterized membrane protein (GlpM family)
MFVVNSSFILLVKQEMLFVRALKSCLRSPASYIIHISLVIAGGVPLLPTLPNVAHYMVVGTGAYSSTF